MSKGVVVDISGQRFGKWTAIRPDLIDGRRMWLVRCDCGFERHHKAGFLRSGATTACRSCGHATHGASTDRQASGFGSWERMVRSVTDPNHTNYEQYGGTGLDIDPRWLDYTVFIADMGAKPTPQHTIDRIDNAKGYWLGNCRWATQQEQNQNTTRNKLDPKKVRAIRQQYAKGGVSQREIAEFYDVDPSLISRVVRGEYWDNIGG